MKILVTGDTGFIGKHLVKELKQNNDYDVWGVSSSRVVEDNCKGSFIYVSMNDNLVHKSETAKHYTCRLTNLDSVRCMMRDCKPDCIIHLAANSSGKPDELHPHSIIDYNIKATQLLAHYATPGTRFVFASSIVVYGDPKTEQRFNESDTCNPTSMYGATKIASEHILNTYHNSGKIDLTNLRFCAVVGSGLTHGVVYDFINKLRSDSTHLELIGSAPGSTKPYIHVYDAVGAIKFVLDQDLYGNYNVCYEDEISIDTLADNVMFSAKIFKDKKWLGQKANWVGDNRVIRATASRLKASGWKTNYSTSVGAIRDAVQYTKDIRIDEDFIHNS